MTTPDAAHSYPRRHQHPDHETLVDCLLIDATFASWLLKRNLDENDILDYATVRHAWRTAWVEGMIRERLRTGRHQDDIDAFELHAEA